MDLYCSFGLKYIEILKQAFETTIVIPTVENHISVPVLVFQTDIVKSTLSSFSHMQNHFVFILFHQSKTFQDVRVFLRFSRQSFIYIAKLTIQDLKLPL